MGSIWCILIGRIRLTSAYSDIWPSNLWFYFIERNTFLFDSKNRETVFVRIWTRTIFSTEPRNILIINRIFFRFLGSVKIYSVSERFQTSGTVSLWRKFWFWDIKITKTDNSGHFEPIKRPIYYQRRRVICILIVKAHEQGKLFII